MTPHQHAAARVAITQPADEPTPYGQVHLKNGRF